MVRIGLASNPTRGFDIATADPRNKLPTTTSYRYDDVRATPRALSDTITLTNEANTNIFKSETGLLPWHARLGHLVFHKIRLCDLVPSLIVLFQSDD
jgi:hypothetical protein